VEFVGGLTYGEVGAASNDRNSPGITVGLGVSLFAGKDLEILGNTLFTVFPQGRGVIQAVPAPEIFAPFSTTPEGRYSCDILVGARLHGYGSAIVHPFLLFQGGIQLLREAPAERWYGVAQIASNTNFLKMSGTEDLQLYGVVNVGGGLQFAPSQSLLINVQASFRLLFGTGSDARPVVPVIVTVQLPV